MDSIIAAHLPDFETWQSSCLLFDDIPLTVEDNRWILFKTVIYEIPTKLQESMFWKQKRVKLVYNHIHKLLYITIPLNDQDLEQVISYYSGGEIYEEYKRLGGNYHGKYISYYSNGNKRKECNYEHDKKHGRYISYYENGNIKVECNYEHGQLHGKYISYYENGNIKLNVIMNMVNFMENILNIMRMEI